METLLPHSSWQDGQEHAWYARNKWKHEQDQSLVNAMDKQKLEYFRNLLLEQRRQAIEDLGADRATALEGDDGVEDAGEMSELDLNRSTALTLGSRQSQLIEEIDEALGRIEDGTYGQCSRCGKPLDEERLKAMPTAKYDAECQAAIEAAQGIETPSL
jgi:DnaK suppressor protein